MFRQRMELDLIGDPGRPVEDGDPFIRLRDISV